MSRVKKVHPENLPYDRDYSRTKNIGYSIGIIDVPRHLNYKFNFIIYSQYFQFPTQTYRLGRVYMYNYFDTVQ